MAHEVERGRFRQDLYYRLQVIPLVIPALCERGQDILLLAEYFLAQFGRERGETFSFSPEAKTVLESYSFPGNVRELKNMMERLSVLAPGSEIKVWDLPCELRDQVGATGSEQPRSPTLVAAVKAAEIACIQQALDHCRGKRVEAASRLGISRKNLWEKMKNYKMD